MPDVTAFTIRCVLRRGHIGGSALRTAIIAGLTNREPTLGCPFLLIASGLAPGTTRVVNTSPIVESRREDRADLSLWTVITATGSQYLIGIFPGSDSNVLAQSQTFDSEDVSDRSRGTAGAAITAAGAVDAREQEPNSQAMPRPRRRRDPNSEGI